MPTPCLHMRPWTLRLFDRRTGLALGKLSMSHAMSGKWGVDGVISLKPVPSPYLGSAASSAM